MKTASKNPGAASSASPAKAVDLRCEFAVNPLGIGETEPRLSWRMDDAREGARQTAWRLVAATSPEKLSSAPDLWDTGVVADGRSLDIVYAGAPLRSRSRVFWKVRIWDADGAASDWSEPARFELGLLRRTDWKADWIGRDLLKTEGGQASPYIRRGFRLDARPVSARLYITARGLYEAHVNGHKVGGDHFTPGWTVFSKRLQVQTYDVTDLLVEGDNAIGAILGEGWYSGFRGDPTVQLALLAQLEVALANGRKAVLATDGSWRTAFGPIVGSTLYHGERYDATRELEGWDTAAFDDDAWDPALVVPAETGVALDPARSLPVREQEVLHTVEQTEPKFGVHIFDLGQNMVGWTRVKVRAPRGHEIRIRFGEMLQPDGTLYTANLRSAKATDTYICRGGGEEVVEPRFTFHGFRYVELTNLCEKPSPDDVEGVVLHSEMEQTGWFECSNPLLNRLQQNISWGQRGNYLDVPTDCPQRDERLGWTGDAQVFCRTAAFNRDVAGFFTKWLVDLVDTQSPEGAFPNVAPDVLSSDRGYSGGAAAWADAGVICPWNEYLCYGDVRVLERCYPAMARWNDWQVAHSKDGIIDYSWFGDWLGLDVWSLNPRFDRPLTPGELISTAYFAKSTELMAKAAEVLGKTGDAKRYKARWKAIRKAFCDTFMTAAGRLVSETQTAYLLALAFDLVPPARRAAAGERLVKAIAAHRDHLSTGFVGTPLLAPVLTAIGRTDLAYKILLNKDYPSWLCEVMNGATTMWERWNSYTKESGFGDVSMNSFNHYAYGAIGEWMYATMAGIGLDPAAPAYRHVLIQPIPPPRVADAAPEDTVTWAEGRLKTRYGFVSSRWEALPSGGYAATFTIPPNTTATVALPGQEPFEVSAGTYRREF